MIATKSQRMLISLDYELFFGSKPGSVENCFIEPVDELLKVLDKYGAALSLFVDAGFLVKLKEQSPQYPELQDDLQKILSQLNLLTHQKHDVQLHIHPHWEDSYYDGTSWNIVTDRYRLHDFDDKSIHRIVSEYKAVLTKISEKEVFAYRAGGWCIQPFERLRQALSAEQIWLDSTSFELGLSNDIGRDYDFSKNPEKTSWLFKDDPSIEDQQGDFLEIPISSAPLSPLFFWKMAILKKISAGDQHRPFGDGYTMEHDAGYYFRRLTQRTHSPVTLDGIKASTLANAFKYHTKKYDGGIFNVMGHPKSLSRYSISQLDKFLRTTPDLEFITFQDLKHLKPLP